MPDVVILGCGYTGRRVAERMLHRGHRVMVTVRNPSLVEDLRSLGARVVEFDLAQAGGLDIPDGALVLHSIPGFATELFAHITGEPRRVVYFSTTGVYGAIRDVDETTSPAPDTESAKQRLAVEEEIQGGPWSSLVLRPAAIYGPGRGIHVSMREGRFQLAGTGYNFVSRIHVDDLAAHAEAALLSEVTGEYPAGDELPCTSREIAGYCAQLLGVAMPPSVPRDTLHETRRADRRVDGRAIRRLLNVTLQYPTYREGIAASL